MDGRGQTLLVDKSSGDGPIDQPGQPWGVLLYDERLDRRLLLAGIVKAAGGRVIFLDKIPCLRSDSGEKPIVLVAVDAEVSCAHPHFGLIAAGKSIGSTVIAYCDGAKQWPLAQKCLPLLAGATQLLDSLAPDFAPQLRQILLDNALRLEEEEENLRALRESMRSQGLVGESPAMTEVFRTATRFSQISDLPVLITGESGTGKELLARAIGSMDPKRKDGPFVAVNCAAINPTIMESEFFGHRRGAFTGAERDRKGLIRACEGGTLFLDEIGDLELGLQTKLLRVLQENRVLPVGDEQETSINVRFIAATNQDLETLVAERRFRGDLFHRLRVLSVHIPPLRERSADLGPLVQHFLLKRQSLQPYSPSGVTEDFLEAIRRLELPGNVRQLENLIYHALARRQTRCPLDLNDLPAQAMQWITNQDTGAAVATKPEEESSERCPGELKELVKRILDGQGWNLGKMLTECERHVFQAAMQRTGGNQSQTARLLGITPRSVYNKVHKFRSVE